jgi:hypothetical protein
MSDSLFSVTDDEDWYLDLAIKFYTACLERHSTHAGYPKQMIGALHRTIDGLTTSSFSWKGVKQLNTGEKQKDLLISQLILFRETLAALKWASCSWESIPADSPLPESKTLCESIYNASQEWAKVHKQSELPPFELWWMMLQSMLNFDVFQWPDMEFEDSSVISSYKFTDVDDIPDFEEFNTLFRQPMIIGTLILINERYFTPWNQFTDLTTLTPLEDKIVSEIQNEMIPGVGLWLKSQGRKWPGSIDVLLPFSESSSFKGVV